MERALKEFQQSGRWDLEALEMGLREAVHQWGARVVEKLVNAEGGGYQGPRLGCRCGGQARFMGYREKRVLTVLGPLELQRAYYYCAQCGQGDFPQDRHLDIVGTRFSPGVRRLAARVGAKEAFREGAEDLKELAGIEIGSKEVERISKKVGQEMEQVRAREEEAIWQGTYQVTSAAPKRLYIEMDGGAIPVISREVQGRKGRQSDGSAKTREVKLGCCFTQVGVDEQGRPVREPESTSYTAAVEEAEVFGRRLYGEAYKRGVSLAQEVVVLGDGAAWIWNLVGEHFPQATEIVDIYHARQHLYDLEALMKEGTFQKCLDLLNGGKIERLVKQLSKIQTNDPDQQEKIQQEIQYFDNNRQRMRYADFRSRKLFIGSGVVEAGCKTVIGARLKQSGMFWSVDGANAILTLRSNLKSGYWENFWEARPQN